MENNKLYIGSAIVNETCLVLFAVMDDASYRPAIALTVSLDGLVATIDTLSLIMLGTDNVNGVDLATIELFDISVFRSNYGLCSKDTSTCAFQAHVIDVSKANWSAAVNVYEWAGLTDWRCPNYKRLRRWKREWWRIVLDAFDLDIDD